MKGKIRDSDSGGCSHGGDDGGGVGVEEWKE